MQRSFKISVFLAALGMATLITAQPSPVLAEMTTASTAADSAETTARINAERAEKRARAAKNRAAMQKKIDDGNKKFNDMADMDEDDQKEVDARVKTMLGNHPDALSAQPVAVNDKAVNRNKVPQRNKTQRVIRSGPANHSAYRETSRAAPEYLKDYLELVEALEKKHAPYSPPPLKR